MKHKTTRRGGLAGSAYRLVARAARLMPGASAALVVLAVMQSFLQGASLMLLLPVLSSLGVGAGTGTGKTSRLVEWLKVLFESVGVPHTLATLLGFVFVVALLSAAVGLTLTWIGHAMFRRLVSGLQLEAYEALVHARSSFLSGRRRGDAATVLTKLTEQAGQAFFLIVRFLSAVLMVLALLVVAVMQAWGFVVAVLALFAVGTIPMRKNSKIVHSLARQCHERARDVGSHLAEHLRLLPTIKALGAERQSVRMIAAQVLGAELLVMRFKRRIEAVRAAWEVIVIALLCLSTYMGIAIFQLPIDRLLLLIGVCVRLVPALQTIVSRSEQLPLMLTAYDEVVAFTDEGGFAAEPTGSTTIDAETRAVTIELRHVWAQNDDTAILRDVSLTLAPASLTALVGASGGGKTTIAGVILGIVEASQGEVRIGGIDIGVLDRRAWRQKVGFVSQDLPILTGTVRDNLRLAAPDADDLAMYAALRAAGIDRFVRSLPGGLDAFLGEHGGLISGGERQRLVIARALVRKPVLLILDEATNALDANTAQELLQTIEGIRRHTAVLTIAHNLDTVRTADLICVVEKGRIVEQGSWDALIDGNGRLSRLAAVQKVG